MEYDQKIDAAVQLMGRFSEITGLVGEGPNRRYLWTDAFAVCNYLELFERTGEAVYGDLAHRLADHVHSILGRHRQDDARTGWISGLDEEEGARRPTAGGLRIGKDLPERGPDDTYDPQREWERDGQYFHYLTKWIQALQRLYERSGQTTYFHLAVDLAKAAHRGFLSLSEFSGHMHLYWKMSIDLTSPQVRAMGQHDPLDGYLTFRELQKKGASELREAVDDMELLCRERNWITDDPLGLGGMLCDCLRAARLGERGGDNTPMHLTEEMLRAIRDGLQQYIGKNSLRQPAQLRLAFREIGLAIGLHALDMLREHLRVHNVAGGEEETIGELLESLVPYGSLAGSIERFWLEDENREAESWQSHREINMVMLATALLPEGYLGR